MTFTCSFYADSLILFPSHASCDPLFLLCFLVGWCLGECQCSCSVPCQGKQMANRSSPQPAAGKTPSLPANFMLLCRHGDAITKDSSWSSVHVCVYVRMTEREGERRTNGQRASRRSQAVTLIYPRPSSSSSVLFSSSSLFTILCPLPSGRPSSQTQCSWAQLSMFSHTDRPLSWPLYLFGCWWICPWPPRGGARSC